MIIPDNLLYSKSHEWILIEGNTATIGITDFAQSELSDVIFLEFPENEQEVRLGDPFGTIEAVKTVADLVSPFSGVISEVNSLLIDAPELVNSDPYGDGWIVKILLKDSSQRDDLITADEYKKLIG